MIEPSPIGQEMQLKRQLLRHATIWLYNTKYSENPGEDKGDPATGNKEVIRTQHSPGGYAAGKWDNNIWIFPGYFNTLLKPPTADGTPKVKRRVIVNHGDRIFCIVGLSTAGDIWEQDRLKKRGQDKSLIEIARSIQLTYQQLRLTVDGVLIQLEPVEVEDVDVTVPDDDPAFNPPKRHPLVKYYDGLPIKQKDKASTSGVAHVRLFSLDRGTHIIDLFAKSPGDDPTGDIAYEIDVRYEVTVQ